MILFLVLLMLPAVPAFAVDQPTRSVSSAQLDQALNDVLEQREYRWRLTREKKEKPQGLMADLWNGLVRFTNRWIRPLIDLYRRIQRWIADRLSPSDSAKGDDKLAPGGQQPLLIFLMIALVAAIAIGYWKWRKKKSQLSDVLTAQPATAIPDIRDENITADQLPEDEWYRLSSDLMAQGEYRLALRALFMATLAHLSRAELVRIARFKSNRDYLMELDRKAYEQQELRSRFRENVAILERIWYGRHPADDALVRQFAQDYQEMRNHMSAL